MFTIVRRYIKTSLFFFLAGLVIGAWILVLQIIGGRPGMGVLISAHTHLILFGFVITLIMGVAYWMFPRPAKEDFRYSPKLVEINYWLITLGTLVRTFGELGQYFYRSHSWLWPISIGAAAQLIAGGIFAWNIWTRIRPIGSQIREAKGERF